MKKNNIASSETFTLLDHPNYFPSGYFERNTLMKRGQNKLFAFFTLYESDRFWLSLLHTKGSIPKWVFKERFLWHRTRNLSILLVNCDRIGSLRADKLCGVFCFEK